MKKAEKRADQVWEYLAKTGANVQKTGDLVAVIMAATRLRRTDRIMAVYMELKA